MVKHAFVFGWLLLLAAAHPIYADQGDSHEPKEILCEITVIYAQKKSPYLDKNLKPLWKYLSDSFGGKFDWFEFIETKNTVLKLNEKMEYELPNGDRLGLTFAGVTENKKLFRIHLEIADLKTKVRAKDGALFFQAGRKHKNGIIILAIKAISNK